MANAGPLAVREDSSKGVVIQGLSLHKVCFSLFVEYIKDKYWGILFYSC